MNRNNTVGLLKEDQSIMYRNVRKYMEKIACDAGVEMKKTVSVILQAECFRNQAEGVKIINETLKVIETTTDRDTVIGQAGVATGYANAMQHLGLMSESELEDIVAVIDQTVERALRRIETHIPHSSFCGWKGKTARKKVSFCARRRDKKCND